MTTTQTGLEDLIGQTLIDNDGDKIGSISDIYLDEQTEQPEWFAVRTGLLGTRVNFVPVQGMSRRDDEVKAPFSKSQVKESPHAEADGALSQDEEAALYSHYGMSYSEDSSDSGLPNGQAPQNTGHDTSGPNTDDAMTRSEEEMSVSKQTKAVGKARLRKYLVSEQKTITVPVTHEEVSIEREPITEANVGAAMEGKELSDEEHEVTLHVEEAVVNKTVVPKERVRLATEAVTENQQVSADLTKEQIEADAIRADSPSSSTQRRVPSIWLATTFRCSSSRMRSSFPTSFTLQNHSPTVRSHRRRVRTTHFGTLSR